jgi:hypothetical protein
MEATATGDKPMTDIPNSRRSPMEHERYLPDAQTDAPELQRFSPYAVDGGFDAYGQMEEDEFGDYYNREDADATIQSAQAKIAKLREELEVVLPFADFGDRMLESWEQHYDVDASDRFDWAKASGVILPVPGGYDPEQHTDEFGASEPGDDWFNARPSPNILAAYRAAYRATASK